MKSRRQLASTDQTRAGASASWAVWPAVFLLVAATAAAYSHSFSGPFIFDDQQDIVDNMSIRHLWPISGLFHLQRNSGRATLHGRPVVNISLALDYAACEYRPFGYHLTNLLIHVLAGLTLFGIVRRTLLLPSLGGRFTAAATTMALATALLWTLHPLDTEAVTYVIQRFESMMALFYLAALYAALRCGTSPHPHRWGVAAVTAAALGMGCKEVAVSVPISILLYDRAFLAGSFREALRRRWGMYAGLATTWAAFALLLTSSYDRGSWAGYGLRVSGIEYARSQFGVILHYLRLSFWPSPLVFDYGWRVARTVGEILPGAVVIGGLAAATVYALVRWPKWGFLGATFFMVLAPTSSVLPIRDLAFEHRMYLPLAVVVAGIVIGGWLAGRWAVGRRMISSRTARIAGCLFVTLASISLGILTFQRNLDYQSALSIWQDTLAKAQGNPRAHYNVGIILLGRGQTDEAMAHFRRGVEVRPDSAEAHYNFGRALMECRREDEAMVECQKAVELKPDDVYALHSIGQLLAGRGRVDEAMAQYEKVLEIKPDYVPSHYNLGSMLARQGRVDEAIAHFRIILEISPGFAPASKELAEMLRRKERAK